MSMYWDAEKSAEMNMLTGGCIRVIANSTAEPLMSTSSSLSLSTPQKKLTCTPQFTSKGRFKLLDVEDDMEW